MIDGIQEDFGKKWITYMIRNKVLTDKDRADLNPHIEEMWKLCPQTMARKIKDANVQQAFIYSLVKKLVFFKLGSTILSVGCYDDTAYYSLSKSSYDIVGIDPAIDYDLHTYLTKFNNKYDIVFSTSVIEHVKDDELFLGDICKSLNPNGYGILTMDFKDDYKIGDKLPKTDERFYTIQDLEVRLPAILKINDCCLDGEHDWTDIDSFSNEGCNYSFATFVFRKIGNV
jgi:SAM-dependent methyltransferase